MEAGAVSRRVALLLRSAEAQPVLLRFVRFIRTISSIFVGLRLLDPGCLCQNLTGGGQVARGQGKK